MKGKRFEIEGRIFQRSSRWTEIKFEFIGGAPYVNRNGQKHYLESFLRLGSPWIGGHPMTSEDGEVTLIGIDTTYTFNPEYFELDDSGEMVRFYTEVTREMEELR